ncbi:hypothetical protein D9C73_020316 [Collichthys lucidus]|uniref:Uncharacterized protein n=1 Tax=Collichthys lucidus TaxID=240159 RepID=A0A4U5VE12_COLLU|nr:hypothetical protein D9C73_020316 [Collichthys lucidus]
MEQKTNGLLSECSGEEDVNIVGLIIVALKILGALPAQRQTADTRQVSCRNIQCYNKKPAHRDNGTWVVLEKDSVEKGLQRTHHETLGHLPVTQLWDINDAPISLCVDAAYCIRRPKARFSFFNDDCLRPQHLGYFPTALSQISSVLLTRLLRAFDLPDTRGHILGKGDWNCTEAKANCDTDGGKSKLAQSHLPLDVSVYGPFKTYYNKAMGSWMRTLLGQTASNHAIPEIVHETFLSAMAPRNILSGFRSTGGIGTSNGLQCALVRCHTIEIFYVQLNKSGFFQTPSTPTVGPILNISTGQVTDSECQQFFFCEIVRIGQELSAAAPLARWGVVVLHTVLQSKQALSLRHLQNVRSQPTGFLSDAVPQELQGCEHVRTPQRVGNNGGTKENRTIKWK